MPEELQEDTYDETPAGWYRRWNVELEAAKEFLAPWHKQAKEVVRKYRHKFDAKELTQHLGLFHADVETWRASLFGSIPSVDVSRRFADANDDVARVGAEIQERLLNCDIEKDSDTFLSASKNALKDWLTAGFGNARLRYEAEFETEATEPKLDDETGEELAPGFEQEKKSYECVNVDYLHWEDVRWSKSRTGEEMRWMAFREQMTRSQLVKRFGDKIGKVVPLNTKKTVDDGDSWKRNDPWGRADVWEIWSKEHKRVFWYVDGHNVILDEKPDPLELESFFPCPQPLMANLATDEFVPVPDYVIAQDLYVGIDELYTRLCLLEKAMSVKGVADRELAALIDNILSSPENTIVPYEAFAMLREKGGLKGAIDFIPLDMISAAIAVLSEKIHEKIGLLQQITGVADLMRGASNSAETATAQSIKARFGSIRSEDKQNEFARWVTDVQRLKAEIISKHFDTETILQESNIMQTPDAQLAPQAVELIKSDFAGWRIQVKPESVSFKDYAALKNERSEFIQALSAFLQAAVPAAQAMPNSTPMLLEMLKWAMAGFRGASTIEGVLDRAIAEATQQAQAPKPPPPPDPKVMAAQLKMQGDQQKAQMDMQIVQAKGQADIAKINVETQSAIQQQAAQADLQREGSARHRSREGLGQEPRAAEGGGGGCPLSRWVYRKDEHGKVRSYEVGKDWIPENGQTVPVVSATATWKASAPLTAPTSAAAPSAAATCRRTTSPTTTTSRARANATRSSAPSTSTPKGRRPLTYAKP
jgi:hypothetical protein